MTQSEKDRLLHVIDQAFADPYPPELENRPGRIAWRHEHVKEMIAKEFGGAA